MSINHLFLLHSSPYQDNRTKESIDLILANAVFDEKTAVLFINDGVYQLLENQQAQEGQKNISKTLQSFPLYEIEPYYVCEHSLAARSLDTSQLSIEPTLVNKEAIQSLIADTAKVTNLL